MLPFYCCSIGVHPAARDKPDEAGAARARASTGSTAGTRKETIRWLKPFHQSLLHSLIPSALAADLQGAYANGNLGDPNLGFTGSMVPG